MSSKLWFPCDVMVACACREAPQSARVCAQGEPAAAEARMTSQVAAKSLRLHLGQDLDLGLLPRPGQLQMLQVGRTLHLPARLCPAHASQHRAPLSSEPQQQKQLGAVPQHTTRTGQLRLVHLQQLLRRLQGHSLGWFSVRGPAAAAPQCLVLWCLSLAGLAVQQLVRSAQQPRQPHRLHISGHQMHRWQPLNRPHQQVPATLLRGQPAPTCLH